MKVKICRLRRKKDKELSKLASQLIATSTPISFRESEYSSESEDECGEKVDFLVSSQLWKCLSPGVKRRAKQQLQQRELSKGSAFAMRKAIGNNLSNKIRINETVINLQKAVKNFFDRDDVSRISPDVKKLV